MLIVPIPSYTNINFYRVSQGEKVFEHFLAGPTKFAITNHTVLCPDLSTGWGECSR